MAYWYVSSVAYTAVATWAASHAYSVGALVRQLAAPTVGNERVFRCTTAGTSAATEPTWTLTKGSTTTSGGATFTEVTGSATYMGTQGTTATWLCPHARLNNALLWSATAADTVVISSDHAETQTTAITLPSTAGAVPSTIVSVARTGMNFPPISTDVLPGASITTTGTSGINFQGATAGGDSQLYQGISFNCGTGTTAASIVFDSDSKYRAITLKNCALALLTTGGGSQINPTAGSGGQAVTTWDNTTVKFSDVTQTIYPSAFGKLIWQNTPSAILGTTFPTYLFQSGMVGLRGVDLSALGATTTLMRCDWTSQGAGYAYDLRNCKLGAAVVLNNAAPAYLTGWDIAIVNCDSGNTGYNSEWIKYGGVITTSATTYHTGGASDGVQAVSHKYVSNSVVSIGFQLRGPEMFLWNTLTGSPRTVSVEIVSSASLNNNDIWLEVEGLTTTGYPLSSVVNDSILTPVSAAAAQPTSTASWTSPPSTPIYQKLQVTLTPQRAGLIRATVCVAKISTTVFVDPLLTLV